MAKREHILGLTKQTDNKFLNMYAADAVDNNGDGFEYYFATRREEGDLMCQTGELKADGVAIYAVLKDEPHLPHTYLKTYYLSVSLNL